jgi:hypothetical protein
VQSLGTDTLNGKSMQVYQFSTSSQANPLLATGTTKLWVGADDGLPYQSQTNATTDAALFGQTLNGQATITSVYTYDSSITIQPPM